MDLKLFFISLVIILLQCCEPIDDKIHLCDTIGTSYYETDHFISTKINIYTDYEKGLACAKENNYPILLHFTGYGCVGYPVFRLDIIHNKKIEKLLREEFLVISLYVDSPKKLPKQEQKWIEWNGREKHINTYGHKNTCLLYTSPSPRDKRQSRMPSSA